MFADRDVVVIDAGSRLEAVDRSLDLSVGSILAVSGVDAIDLAATHALIKAVRARAEFLPSVMFNRALPTEVDQATRVLREGVGRFLGVEVEVLGALASDPLLVGGLRDGALLAERLAASTLTAAVLPLMQGLRPWRV
jgi:MinD-like ATPase involved in chromosome partitioning or flagellar assembly